MRLLTFVQRDERASRVGLLSADGRRVVDLSAIGVADMFEAVARVGELERAAPHLLRAPGALAYPLGELRLLAPLPVARVAWVEEGGEERAGWTARYVDPAPVMPPLWEATAAPGAPGGRFGIAAVIGGDDTVSATTDPEARVAGYCLAAWLGAATAGGPWIGTREELADRRVRAGLYDLEARLSVDGRTIFEGSWSGLSVGLGAVVARVADAYTLRAGDLLAAPVTQWEGGGEGAEVVFEVERLGALRQRVATPAERIQ